MEEKKYSGFFCKKCKIIPRFQIMHKNQNLKIYNACKCYKRVDSFDIFIKSRKFENICDIIIFILVSLTPFISNEEVTIQYLEKKILV